MVENSDRGLLSVVIPAYNEESRIGSTLDRMLEYFKSQPYPVEIIIVDDGSSDRTTQVVTDKSKENCIIESERYTPNQGKGHAVRHGMLLARGDFILFSDADLATPIEEVKKLFQALEKGADIAIGSRDVPGAQLVRRQSFLREAGGKIFNRCVQFLAVPGIHDTQCGFKLFRRQAARDIFSRCQVNNFSFDVEALYIGRRLGYRIVESPVRWAHQEGSKVRFARDAWRMLMTLLLIRRSDYRLAEATLDISPTIGHEH
ncbi:MAG: glycosyltransferase family 2 protein [Armatimonadetes bacterium]|nr:glycosyltransferase family 2 protein [Armatimonadota bacterium]